MIRKQSTPSGTVKITFALPDTGCPVSVVGDVNHWDPHAHPLRKRSNGTRSVAVELPQGSSVRFRYLDGEGRFFDDPDADALEPNGRGQTHSLVTA
jgi:1,4-alpha-glucan branching enzyme